MQLFFRSIHTRGPAAISWATELTEVVRARTELPVSLWMGMWGAQPGTLTWSAPVEGYAQLAAANAALIGDEKYMAKVAEGAEFVDSVEIDRVLTIIHGEIEGQAPVGSFVGNVVATAQNGKVADATTWAVEMADYAAGITGHQVLVATTAQGPMFEIGWFNRFDDAAAADAAQAKIAADPGYIVKIDGAAGLFQPGTIQRMAQRIA